MKPASVQESSSCGSATLPYRFHHAPSSSPGLGSREAAESEPVVQTVYLLALVVLWIVIVYLELWPALSVAWMRAARQVSR